MNKNKIFRLHSGQVGFTLVELLVVIAIIGILSTVAVVNLNAARNKAKISAALSWLSNINASATLCDASGGLLTDPNDISGYVGGNEICSIAGIGLWSDSLPQNYNSLVYQDLSREDSYWVLILFSAAPFNNIGCIGDAGCKIY
ncbi:MAG: type II secretion system protein [Patescibacteria group bacterium]|jgi:prepilin-type N-terminal cleavage/methylation domain-containing protein